MNNQAHTHTDSPRPGATGPGRSGIAHYPTTRNLRPRTGRLTTAPTTALGTALAAILAMGSLGTALADNRRPVQHRFTDYAEVISVQPRYQEVSIREPQRECWIEETQHVIRDEGYHYSNQHQNPRYLSRESSRDGRSGADLVVGGLIGGVIGNQLGRNSSDGKRAGATVAGAIIGSAVANEVRSERRHHREPRYQAPRHTYRPPRYETTQVERCRQTAATRYEQRMAGYDVTYRYRGQTYTTNMNRDPGNRLELQVSVSPARQ